MYNKAFNSKVYTNSAVYSHVICISRNYYRVHIYKIPVIISIIGKNTTCIHYTIQHLDQLNSMQNNNT